MSEEPKRKRGPGGGRKPASESGELSTQRVFGFLTDSEYAEFRLYGDKDSAAIRKLLSIAREMPEAL